MSHLLLRPLHCWLAFAAAALHCTALPTAAFWRCAGRRERAASLKKGWGIDMLTWQKIWENFGLDVHVRVSSCQHSSPAGIYIYTYFLYYFLLTHWATSSSTVHLQYVSYCNTYQLHCSACRHYSIPGLLCHLTCYCSTILLFLFLFFFGLRPFLTTIKSVFFSHPHKARGFPLVGTGSLELEASKQVARAS